MIEVTGLTKKYKNFTAVNNISFTVDKGEIFGFLGPNGAGKTTTIKILTGLLSPTEGKALVCGQDVVKEKRDLKTNIGVVFEYQNLYTRLTGRYNLEVFRKLYKVPSCRVDELLKIVGLYERAGDPVKDYSRGMQQRLLIARALLHQPRVLFLDEPTSGLDPHSAKELRNLIKKLSSEGITVFLTTHYLEEAELLCNRVAIIDKGEIVALDKTRELKCRYSSRDLRVRIKENGLCEVLTLSLESDETIKKIKELMEKRKVLSIHSVEPTLEEVFLKITERGRL